MRKVQENAAFRENRRSFRDSGVETTMLELNREQRAVLADKLPDAASVAAGALVFGQFLGDRPFSPGLALVGIGVWASLIVFSLALARRKA